MLPKGEPVISRSGVGHLSACRSTAVKCFPVQRVTLTVVRLTRRQKLFLIFRFISPAGQPSAEKEIIQAAAASDRYSVNGIRPAVHAGDGCENAVHHLQDDVDIPVNDSFRARVKVPRPVAQELI